MKYKIPSTIEIRGYAEVEADSKEAALRKIIDQKSFDWFEESGDYPDILTVLIEEEILEVGEDK